MITIQNAHTYKGEGFKVCRPSPLGNPYPVRRGTTRARSIALYRLWLKDKMLSKNVVSKLLMSLVEIYREEGSLTLICWCVPLPCHAEVIRDHILEISNLMDIENESET